VVARALSPHADQVRVDVRGAQRVQRVDHEQDGASLALDAPGPNC